MSKTNRNLFLKNDQFWSRLLEGRVGKGGADAFLAASWLPSGPWSGPRARTRARPRYRPGSGVGGGMCASHFLLGEMGSRRRVDVFPWRRGPGARSSSGFSPRPLPVPFILTAPAPSSSIHSSTRLSRTLGPSAPAIVRRAARSVSVVAAAARSPAPAVSIVVVISRRSAARRVSFLWLHLIGRLSVALRKLDFNLPATHPLPVQAVKSVFCIAHVLEYAAWLRVVFALIVCGQGHTNVNKGFPLQQTILVAFKKTKQSSSPLYLSLIIFSISFSYCSHPLD